MTSMLIGDALQGMLMLLMLIGAGFWAARRGLLSEGFEENLSRLAIQIAIPALLFVSTISHVSISFVKEIGWLALIPLAGILLGWGLGQASARLFRIPEKDRGVFAVMFSLCNAVFIGLPVCVAIFGEAAMPYVVTFFPANTAIFWTLGNLSIARDGGRKLGGPADILKQVFSPPLLGFLAGLLFVFSGLNVPAFAEQGLTYLGGLTVPLSLLTTGSVLSRMGRDTFRIGKTGLIVLIGRMLISPGLTLALCLLCGAPAMLTNVFTLIACMPIMSQCVIMARLHKANAGLTAQLLTLSTLLSMIWIPLWVLVLNAI